MVEDGQPAILGSIIEQSVIARWSNQFISQRVLNFL
jgi:hypothetical protein